MYNPQENNEIISRVELPVELNELMEKIAESVHDTWAEGRLADGWVLGEKVDSVNRTTPWLIPYDELPEREKDFDRNTAMSTLKSILAAGYRIVKE